MMENSKNVNRFVLWFRAHLEILTLLVFVFAAANAVSLQERYLAGAEWRNIPPEVQGDTLTYFAMMREVTEGNLFVGNPYLFEYRDGISPMASFSILIAAIPLFLGFSIQNTEIINNNLWTGIFVFLLFYFLRTIGFRRYAVFSAIVITISLYGVLLRPVAMQIVFPFYIIFLTALFLWLKESTVKRKYFLTGTVALTAYIYTYLFQVTVFTMFIVFCSYAVMRNKQRCLELLSVAFISIVLILPYLFYTHLLLSHEFYQEMIYRYGIVYGHVLSPEAYFYGRWVAIGFLTLFLFRKIWLKTAPRDGFFFFFVTGGGIILGMISPLFTGFELQTATHIARFSIFWMFLVLLYIISSLTSAPFVQKRFFSVESVFLCVGIGTLLLGATVHLLERATPFSGVQKQDIIETQHSADVLFWLNTLPPHQVVFSPEKLSTFIPTLTTHYVFFNHYIDYTFISDRENNERFWMSRVFGPNTSLAFQEGWDESHGRNNPLSEAKRNADFMELWCAWLLVPEKRCPKPKPTSWQEEYKTPEEVMRWFQRDIVPTLPKKFRDYRVSYIILPHETKTPSEAIIGEIKMVYSDAYFDAYKIIY